MKPEVDTLATVPEVPPAAGPDRALDPPPPDPSRPAEPRPGPACPAVVDGEVALAEGEVEVAKLTERPIAAHNTATAMIHPALRFDSHRRTGGRRAGVAEDADADPSGGDVAGGEVVRCRRRLDTRGLTAQMWRPVRGEPEGSRGGWRVRNRS